VYKQKKMGDKAMAKRHCGGINMIKRKLERSKQPYLSSKAIEKRLL